MSCIVLQLRLPNRKNGPRKKAVSGNNGKELFQEDNSAQSVASLLCQVKDSIQDRKLKETCLKTEKCATKETGVDVCERTVRKQLKEMGFPSREAKIKHQ